jgi:tetratricopeptide (TPR) repeat protein
MAAGAEHGAAAGQLAQADALVKELEDLEDYCFETDRHSRMEAISAKVAKCVDEALAPLQPPPQELNARGLYLKGRALSFLPGQEPKAEELLSKAIKLEPKLLAAWNALGEVHWNTQNYQRARECFEHALEFCGTNALSLRNLSMVLRAVDSEAAGEEDDVVARRRSANFAEALDKAKAAVALDAGDPQNWETLGNAFVGDFFVNARRPDELSRALIAYGKAEDAYNKMGKRNYSLQLNRGMAAKYVEDYELALLSFRKAQEIGAANAAKEVQKVMDLVQRLAGFSQRKGDVKAKHLKDLLEDLKQSGQESHCIRDIRANAGSADVPLMAKVVNIVDRQDELPMIINCCDSFGDFFALSVYNAQPSKIADAVVPMKSTLLIRQPKLREVSVTVHHKTWSYPSVRVAHPGDITVVGAGSLTSAAQSSKFKAAPLTRDSQSEATAGAEEDATLSVQSEAEMVQSDIQVDPKQERWIEQEDAKIRKEEAKAKAKAKAKPKAKGKNQRKDRASEKIVARTSHFEALGHVGKVDQVDIDADLETNTGSESCLDNDKDEKETVEEVEEDTPEKLQKSGPVRWSDLDDSDSDDGLPREVAAHRIVNAQMTVKQANER